MTRKDFIAEVRNTVNATRGEEKKPLTVAEIRTIIETVENVVADVVKANDSIKLNGLGTFSSADVKGREGVTNGVAWKTEDHRTIKFRGTNAMKHLD